MTDENIQILVQAVYEYITIINPNITSIIRHEDGTPLGVVAHMII